MTNTVSIIYGGRSLDREKSISAYRSLVSTDCALLNALAFSKIYYIEADGLVRVATTGEPPLPSHEDVLRSSATMRIEDIPSDILQDGAFLYCLVEGIAKIERGLGVLADTYGVPTSISDMQSTLVSGDQRLLQNLACGLCDDLTPVATAVIRADEPDMSALDIFQGPVVLEPGSGRREGVSEFRDHLSEADIEDFCSYVLPFEEKIVVREFVPGLYITAGAVISRGRTIQLPIASRETTTSQHAFDVLDGVTEEKVRRTLGVLLENIECHTTCQAEFVVDDKDRLRLLSYRPDVVPYSNEMFTSLLEECGLSRSETLHMAIENELTRQLQFETVKRNIARSLSGTSSQTG